MRDLPDSAPALSSPPLGPPEPRQYPGPNWIGLKALYDKEVRRFMKVGMQTVGAPVVTSLLYMLVFSVATSGARAPVGGLPYVVFLAPGLIMMTVLNNAFANSSSSLLGLKMQGLTQDILTPPLSPGELTVGFTAGAVTRGIMVGGGDLAVRGSLRGPVGGPSLGDRLLRPDGLRDHGLHRHIGGPVGGEVRPSGDGDQLRDHAPDLPVGHLLFGCRACPSRSAPPRASIPCSI
ncbi:MAG: ABC transporter permease [Caulobacteraceae bacterium]